MNAFFLFSAIIIMLMAGCRTSLTYTDVSDQAPYKELIGKHYVVLKDCYFVSLTGCTEPTIRLCGVNGLPQELDKNRIGDKINNIEIVGVVPRNSKFTLMKIVKYNLDSNIHIEILIPVISFSSKFNDVEASALKKKYTESDVFEFDGDLVMEVP